VDGKADTCRVYLANPTNYAATVTRDGKNYFEFPLEGDPSVKYLSSFKDFTPDEQKILSDFNKGIH
jgi:hypothetical protein